MSQRCTACFIDLPNGSPAKCHKCAQADADFCSIKDGERDFPSHGGTRISQPPEWSCDNDTDMFRRADDDSKL